MAAEILSTAGIKVDVYDAMPSVGRKFLLAGKGGLNLTHSEAFTPFLARYGEQSTTLKPLLEAFSPDDLRQWAHDLGIDTFVGSSGRVFPTNMKAAPLLRAWLHRLRSAGVNFHMRHIWQGWIDNHPTRLLFDTPNGKQQHQVDAVVLALGGGSWKKLGSTGTWVSLLANRGVDVAALKPCNCGFNTNWSGRFRQQFAGQPVKSVQLALKITNNQANQLMGEFIITEHGIEGGAIYALSAQLRDEISRSNYAELNIDLAPHKTLDALQARLVQPRHKESLSNYLRKRLQLEPVKIALLREVLTQSDLNDANKLCTTIKNLPLRLLSPRPIDEAISTGGGVRFEVLDQQLMLKTLPGVFCAGEMLDWEAPTGGYLLTACFASGRAAGMGAMQWLENQRSVINDAT